MTQAPTDRAQGLALRASAFEAHPIPTLVLDADGRVCAANEASEGVFGRSLAQLRRRPLRDALAPGSALPRLVARADREGATVRERAVEIALADLPVLHAEAVAAPLPEGRVVVALSLRAQVAAPDRTEGTLRSVAGMGRTLAHEIKNPLAGIRGAAQLLKESGGPEDAALAQLIVDETDRIRRLIDRVEAFAEERHPERRPVNIHRVLDRVRALMSVGAGEEVRFRDAFDPSLPHAHGDEDQLIQVFLNLVKNAAEAAKSRGDGRGEVLISTAYRQGYRPAPLEVRIQDNGPGVVPELKERLFDPFVTTKTQGAGLGLTLVAKLVAAHEGIVDFETEPGRTVFRVLLPIARPATSAPPQPISAPGSRSAS